MFKNYLLTKLNNIMLYCLADALISKWSSALLRNFMAHVEDPVLTRTYLHEMEETSASRCFPIILTVLQEGLFTLTIDPKNTHVMGLRRET